ncbi:hypothetical protein IAG41_00220 [Sphingomonas sp. JC676]|uniref:hypothetical protein n=1 Tax=Sphingomonas sp. JC676 TaxID=2768065 RepID=UPI0016580CCB|nr:hypothetical protein [Sphingomonas sp. JC676]MBC9030806.1 hypothetical protein [Sphingomonas sp. JC676]
MKSTFLSARSVCAALLITACGGGTPDEGGSPAQGVAATSQGAAAAGTTTVPPMDTSHGPALVMPPSWMPADWDRNVYPGSGGPLDAAGVLRARQNQLATIPFTLWAVAHDTLVTEAFQPIWVWYTAIRSCDRGIQMSDDLAGEFGDRERGKAALTQARTALRAWAATQPPEMTLYFPATLGPWDAASGAFQLQQWGIATTLKPKDLTFMGPYLDGARVEFWTDRSGQAINHFQAALGVPECPTKDKTKVYKFERMSQWWVVFGDVDRGMGGLPNYKSREMLPPISMTRDAAAAFAQRNPQRKVVVAVTFAPVGSSFVKYTNQSAIRAKFRQVTVSNALDESVLVSKSY